MSKVDRWLLPDGIEEVLPEQARRTECLRRRLLDLFESWGYDYVIPPMLEFTDSLLTGSGKDIDLLTFKVTDQLTGRTLGVRADITPQAARMDAHSLNRDGINRLCYAGHVLHTKPESPLSSRSPIKLGVELFGADQVQAEVEVISLLLETLAEAELDKQYIDLGHVGIFRALAKAADFDEEQEGALFALMQSKAFSEIDRWLGEHVSDSSLKSWLSALPRLSGNKRVIADAREALEGAPKDVMVAIDELDRLASILAERYPAAQLYFDLSELRGYNYHTGIVFGAFAPGVGNAIAKGGRYDHVGDAFGRARPATGFDIDLSAICRLLEKPQPQHRAIFVKANDEQSCWEAVQKLRRSGERVIAALSGQESPADYQCCDRQLVNEKGEWKVISLKN